MAVVAIMTATPEEAVKKTKAVDTEVLATERL